jgi:hypothetical protein
MVNVKKDYFCIGYFDDDNFDGCKEYSTQGTCPKRELCLKETEKRLTKELKKTKPAKKDSNNDM